MWIDMIYRQGGRAHLGKNHEFIFGAFKGCSSVYGQAYSYLESS